MVNGKWLPILAPESVSIASALSTVLTIYLCQIRVHQHWQSKLQLPTARKKEWRPAKAGSSPHAVTCQHGDTNYFSRPRTRNLPIVGWLLVRRATSSKPDHAAITIKRCLRSPHSVSLASDSPSPAWHPKPCSLPDLNEDCLVATVHDQWIVVFPAGTQTYLQFSSYATDRWQQSFQQQFITVVTAINPLTPTVAIWLQL